MLLLFIYNLMTPLNCICSSIKENPNDFCSSLLLVETNEKFLGFELKKEFFSHLHQGSHRSQANAWQATFGALCFISLINSYFQHNYCYFHAPTSKYYDIKKGLQWPHQSYSVLDSLQRKTPKEKTSICHPIFHPMYSVTYSFHGG